MAGAYQQKRLNRLIASSMVKRFDSGRSSSSIATFVHCIALSMRLIVGPLLRARASKRRGQTGPIREHTRWTGIRANPNEVPNGWPRMIGTDLGCSVGSAGGDAGGILV